MSFHMVASSEAPGESHFTGSESPEMCGKCGGKGSNPRAVGARDVGPFLLIRQGRTAPRFARRRSKVIRLTTDICDESVECVIELMDAFALLCNEEREDFSRKGIQYLRPTIYLQINSRGGTVNSGSDLYDRIRAFNADEAEMLPLVNTVATGQCASAAFMIWLAGYHRMFTENTMMMAHQPSTGMNGPATNITANYEGLQKLIENLLNIYVGEDSHLKEKLKESEAYNEWINKNDNAVDDEEHFKKWINETFNDEDNFFSAQRIKFKSFNLLRYPEKFSDQYVNKECGYLTPRGYARICKQVLPGMSP